MPIIELSAPPEFEAVDARDLLDHFLPRLPDEQQRAVAGWSRGESSAAIARAEGIGLRAAQLRIQRGIERLREMAGE